MIKKNQSNIKQKLLLKCSDEQSTIQCPPFQIQECFSVVQYDNRDHSYNYLQNDDLNQSFTQSLQPHIQKPSPQNKIPQIPLSSGNTYQKLDNGTQIKNTDEMKVLCGYCKMGQIIPRGCQQFMCYSCRTVNKILDKCGGKQEGEVASMKLSGHSVWSRKVDKVFLCGNCQIKVRYQPGMSQYIRCSKCNTVNLIPK